MDFRTIGGINRAPGEVIETQVMANKTTDGHIFLDLEEARIHQRHLDWETKVELWIGEYVYPHINLITLRDKLMDNGFLKED